MDEATGKVLRVWNRQAAAYDRQMAFFERVQFAGGREWLGARARGRVLEVAIGTGANLPHYPADVTLSGSSWPPIYGLQWLLERYTIRATGEHFTRRSLPLVAAAGFEVVERERRKAGSVERIHARKPGH